MQIDLYSSTNAKHTGDFFLHCPSTNSCTAFSPQFDNLSYIFECLSNGTYTYFEPNVDGDYLATLDINSTEDFYNYPELFI